MSSAISPPARGGRLAAVWFADIVGYTSLASRDHRAALALVEALQEATREQIEAHHGRLVKFIGDAALAEFTSTSAAVKAADALLRDFTRRSADLGQAAELRIGVHLGEVAAGEDGDIYGDGVNTASRLQSAARPGQILVSEDVWRQLRNRSDFSFAPRGRRRLVGLSRPITLYEPLTTGDEGTASGAPWQPSGGGFVARLSSVRGQFLVGILAFHAVVGWLLIEAVGRVVARGMLPDVAEAIALIWYIGVFPAILLVAWYHGHRHYRAMPRAELAWFGTLLVVLVGLTGAAYSRAGGGVGALPVDGLDPRSIAVLYFDDLSGGDADRHLADGFTEDLIDELSDVAGLDVVSANGVAPFRDDALAHDSIARLLGAGTIVDGSIERVGDQLHVNVRVVDGASGADFRRASFELPLDDLLQIRDEIVAETARSLRSWLGDEIELREQSAATGSVAAWALVQRARKAGKDAEASFQHDDAAGMAAAFQHADSLLGRAAALDPEWVEPIAMSGWLDYRRSRLSHDLHEILGWIERGLVDAQRALALAPEHARALELRGTLNYWRSLLPPAADHEDPAALVPAARADLEAAVRIDPSLASAYNTLSHVYYGDNLISALAAAQRAYEEDTYLEFAPDIIWRLFNGKLDLEQFEEAGWWCAEGERRFPRDYRFAQCGLMVMTSPIGTPDVQRAWTLSARIDSFAPPPIRVPAHVRGLLGVGGVIGRAGMVDSARAVLRRAHEQITPEIDPTRELLGFEAFMRTLTDEEDVAIRLLEQYIEANPGESFARRRGGGLSWRWKGLTDHPDFARIADES